MGKRNPEPVEVASGQGADSPVPSLVARLYSESPFPVRGKIVALLIGAAGPLALAALADGRFARFLLHSSSGALRVSLDEARRLSEGHVLALARYVWQASPEVFGRLATMLGSEDPTLLRSFTGALFMLALTTRARLGRRDRGPGA